MTAVASLGELAAQKHCSVAQLALAWVFHKEGVTAALAGARSQEQARLNAGALQVRLCAPEIAEIEARVLKYVPEPIGADFMSPPRSNERRAMSGEQ